MIDCRTPDQGISGSRPIAPMSDTRSRDLGFEAYGAAAKTYLLSEIVGK